MSSSPQDKGKSRSGGNTKADKNSKRGKEYEKLSLLLFAKKWYELCIDNNSHIRHFAIGREVCIGGDRKLDDLVFRYEDNGSRNLIFIQIKHKEMNKQNEKLNKDKSEIKDTQEGSLKINSRILSGSGSGKMNRDFSLREYFISYLSIRKELEITKSKEFRNGEIKYVAIFTNIGFDKEDLINNGFILYEATDDVRILLQLGKSSIGTQETNNCYQFLKISEVLQTRFKKCSDLHRIATKFARYVVWENHRKDKVMSTDKAPIKYYHVALEKEVIGKSSIQKKDNDEFYCDAKFRKDFINNNETGPKKHLLDGILEAVRDLDKSKRDSSDEDLKNDLRNTEWKVVPHFGDYLPKESSSELHKIAGEFAAYIIKKNERDKIIFGKKETILTHYDVAFEKEVFRIFDQSELSYCKAKFRPEFINNREAGPKQDLKKAIFDSIRGFQSKEGDGLEEILRGFQAKEDDELEGILRELELKVDPYFVKSVNFEEDLQNEWIPIEDAHITDFLNCLVFIVNQPNETDLLTQINSVKEVFLQDTRVGEVLNNMDKNIRDRIEKAHGIYNKDSNNETWIYGEEINEFVKEQQAVVNVAVISCIYEEKVMQYGKFKKLGKLVSNLRDFLNDKFSKVLCLCSSITMLTLIKVLMYLNTKNSPTKRICISIELDDAKCNIITDNIEKAFRSESYNLLTVECRNAVSEDIFKLYCKFSPIIKSNANKKIILIVNENELNNCDHEKFCVKKTDDIIVTDFEPDVDPFKKEIIFFQGQKEKINLEKLTGIADWKSYIADSSLSRIQDEEGIIGATTLIEILQSDKIFVGSKLEGTESLECAYASLPEEIKEINKGILIKKLLQRGPDNYTDVIYIISGILGSNGNEKMKKLIQYLGLVNKKEIIEKQLGDIGSDSRIQVASDKFIDKDFKAICRRHPEKEIFWICIKDENKFLFEKFYNPSFYFKIITKNELKELSTGPVSNFLEYTEESKTTSVEEENLIKQIRYSKTVIIVGDPGTGKTAKLTKFYETKYESISFNKSLWIIRINLRDHGLAIKNIKIVKRIIDVVNFMSEIDSKLNNSLSKSLLIHALRNNTISKPLLLVVDGFDEVSGKKARVNVISFLKFIIEETPSKLWVSSRRHYKETLEKELSAFAIELKPMNDDSAVAYIEKYLKDRLCLILSEEHFADNYENRENKSIREYANAFLNKMKSVFGYDISGFVGTPLLCNLMLNNSEMHFKNWIEGNVDQNQTFNYLGDDVQIYENIIKGMCDFSCEKYRNVTDEKFWKAHEEIFRQYRQKIAECLIFEEFDEIFEELDEKDIQDMVFLTGIIKSDGSNIEFFPSKLKDFFVAELCVNLIEERKNRFTNKEKNKHILKVILKKPDYKQIRGIINVKLNNAMKSKEFKKCLKYYGAIIDELLGEEESSFIDEKGTLLHIAVAEGNKNIVQFLLESLKGHAVALNKFLYTLDKNGNTSLSLAQYKNDVEIAKLLSDAEAELKEVTGDPINAQRKEVSN